MKEIPCRCGTSKKRFKFDIGEFYVEECCKAAGFDDLGRASQVVAQYSAQTRPDGSAVVTDVSIGDAVKVGDVISQPTLTTSALKPGRGKLKDMRVEDLKAIAKEKGIEGAEGMTKKQLIAAILQ